MQGTKKLTINIVITILHNYTQNFLPHCYPHQTQKKPLQHFLFPNFTIFQRASLFLSHLADTPASRSHRTRERKSKKPRIPRGVPPLRRPIAAALSFRAISLSLNPLSLSRSLAHRRRTSLTPTRTALLSRLSAARIGQRRLRPHDAHSLLLAGALLPRIYIAGERARRRVWVYTERRRAHLFINVVISRVSSFVRRATRNATSFLPCICAHAHTYVLCGETAFSSVRRALELCVSSSSSPSPSSAPLFLSVYRYTYVYR